MATEISSTQLKVLGAGLWTAAVALVVRAMAEAFRIGADLRRDTEGLV